MSIRDARREAALDRIADHLLAAGLAGASLRPLARAAGTSDRMLLYYFTDKDELLGLALERIALRLANLLDAAIPAGTRLPEPALRAAVWAGMRAPAMAPYMRIWLDLAAASGRGEEPHRAIAGRIADLFHAWLADRLDGPADAAARLFGRLEGALLIDLLGRPALAEVAIRD